jgi:23S rRNA (uracil1939-C5)-methyltransferase
MSHTNAKSEITLEIGSLSYGPYGVGRIDGKAVMVPKTAPGDLVAARIVESKARYAIGEALRVIEPSPLRQLPPCPFVNECGGCPWQHIRYDAQLKAKQQNVENALTRIGRLEGFELRPIIPSSREYHYRRRIRLQRDERKRLGFFRASSHDLIEIASCLIADEKLNGLIEPLRQWGRELATSLEYVEIATGDEARQIVAFGKGTQEFISRDNAICERLITENAGISGLVLYGPNWRKTWNQAAISAIVEHGISMEVDADVFTQINAEGNRKILDELLAAGEFQSQDRVLELYCGAGNFTLSMAKRVSEVVAVEGSRLAIQNGKLNAQRNGLENVRWVCSAVPAALSRLKQRREKFARLVLDPPRAGAKGLEAELASFGAEKILYLSCDPATLARDLGALGNHGYKLRMVQAIDLFPHSFHVETLALMTR